MSNPGDEDSPSRGGLPLQIRRPRLGELTPERQLISAGAVVSGDLGGFGESRLPPIRLESCRFEDSVDFSGATFTGDAMFNEATFTGYAGFTGASFASGARFGEAIFTGTAGFEWATFTGTAGFE